MSETMNDTYELIVSMFKELKAQHRMPLFIPVTDIIKRSGKNRQDTINDLSELAKAGKIRKRKSINDNLVQLL